MTFLLTQTVLLLRWGIPANFRFRYSYSHIFTFTLYTACCRRLPFEKTQFIRNRLWSNCFIVVCRCFIGWKMREFFPLKNCLHIIASRWEWKISFEPSNEIYEVSGESGWQIMFLYVFHHLYILWLSMWSIFNNAVSSYVLWLFEFGQNTSHTFTTTNANADFNHFLISWIYSKTMKNLLL